jgi:hypothetical protein
MYLIINSYAAHRNYEFLPERKCPYAADVDSSRATGMVRESQALVGMFLRGDVYALRVLWSGLQLR